MRDVCGAALVLRSRVKRGVSKDAPKAVRLVGGTILRDAMLCIAPQDEDLKLALRLSFPRTREIQRPMEFLNVRFRGPDR
jgi:hypothetical protein